MADLDHAFQRLCHEAVLACGADVAAIERYVVARTATMSAEDREHIRRDLDRVLAYQAPERSLGAAH